MHKPFLSDIIQPIVESYISKFKVTFQSKNEYNKLILHTQGTQINRTF